MDWYFLNNLINFFIIKQILNKFLQQKIFWKLNSFKKIKLNKYVLNNTVFQNYDYLLIIPMEDRIKS